jgi:sialidase-1
MLLFSNPAHNKKRMNGTIRISENEGRSWKYARTLYKGNFAYSCLAQLTEREFAILFERDEYLKISYSRLDISWLRNL